MSIRNFISLTPCSFFEAPPVKRCLIRFIQKYGGGGGGGGLTSVTTEDSGSVTFTGTGTAEDPLTAEVTTSEVPPGLTPIGTAAQIVRVNGAGTGLEYVTHASGTAASANMSGAIVPASLSFNASGHNIIFTTRTLTTDNINAVNGLAINPAGTGWLVPSAGTRCISSASNAPTADLWTGIFITGLPTADEGARIALREGQMYIRTRNAGVNDIWRQVVVAPAPPTTGTFVLTSTDGVLSWEVNTP